MAARCSESSSMDVAKVARSLKMSRCFDFRWRTFLRAKSSSFLCQRE